MLWLVVASEDDPLDFIQRDVIARAVVELRRAGGRVRRDALRVFQRATVEEVGGDAGGPEGVA